MEKDARDYLHEELSYFEKSAEVQFTHFMQVFYFWTAVVTAPITAGLLVKQGADAFQFALPLILVLIAPLGWFLSAKMFDIRCSQLTYISKVNYYRDMLYKGVKDHLSKEYKLPFPPDTDLRKKALTDFGLWMAITMSGLDAVYLGFGIPMLQNKNVFNWCIFFTFFIFGICTYFVIILWRGPKSNDKQADS